MDTRHPKNMNRREMLKVAGGAIVASGAALRTAAGATLPAGSSLPAGIPQEAPCLDGGPLYMEVYPTSPFILEPFTQEFVNPVPLKPASGEPSAFNRLSTKSSVVPMSVTPVATMRPSH